MFRVYPCPSVAKLAFVMAGVASSMPPLVAQDPARPSPSSTTFRTDARLVRVSVVVHDRDGWPVRGLTAGDFELLEDRRPVPVSLFFVEGAESPARPATTDNVVTNSIEGPSASGVTLILYDRLNTHWDQQRQAKDHVIKFLRQLRPTDRVGFYVLEDEVVTVLHDFSRDAASLLKALERASSQPSGALAASEEPARPDAAADAMDLRLESWVTSPQQQVSGFFTARRLKSTTLAMEAIARSLAAART
jgi:VWFA-related protein